VFTNRLLRLTLISGCVLASTAPAATALKVTWMRGDRAPDTPAKYDRVGVIKVGPAKARNVLVLEPGTSAGSAYFVPLAKWIVAKTKGWQVWSVERRENLFEDQSVLNLAKKGKASPTAVFNYYLGFLSDTSVTHHFNFKQYLSLQYPKQWGMQVAVGDLREVIAAARKLGGKVVLGGHSLGGSVVTAYATWNFHGRSGADQLAGLIYDDGGSLPAMSATNATAALDKLEAPSATPWLAFGGIPAPFAGVFNATGSLSALLAPNQPSIGQESSVIPSYLKPPVRVTNLAQYGYALNVGTSPPALAAAKAHLGAGVAAAGPIHGWDGAGALTPINRFATMFSGLGINNVDGTEWYFPQRLALDTGAVDNGNANPAQAVLGVHSTMGHRLPRNLLIYAFDTSLGGLAVLADAQALAAQSRIPRRNLTLVDRHTTYAHNDPAGAYPSNAFFAHLIPFLRRITTRGR
jgi:pimeloyl-ACP methyl ester carboxylesterase